ncbi:MULTISPECIES: monovalent cation/H+ antiporter complex subunit F [Streptomyces]|uniref:monovalent cation/H+ antiporter complex subunit F n=1 Tax=Streptomyces TaxID=1883 RepID=UPI0004CD0D70|nr:MrpF/PhaF family protein [Streptomyces durhamensis]
MNGWILAATVCLGGGGAAALWGVTTGPPARRVVAQNMTTSALCPALLLLSQGYGRPAYVDLALLLALLGPVGTLVFARLLSDDLEGGRPSAWGLTWTAAGLSAVVVAAVCAATGPGRALVKLLVVGALLIAGNVIASRALAGGFRGVRGG